MKSPSDPTAERLIAALIDAFFTFFGWLTLWQGEISIHGKSGISHVLSGNKALGVAGVFFLAAALGLSLLMRSFAAGRSSHVLAVLVLLLPPMIFVAARR